jgi:iron complex transport system ATP-binding protein
LDWNIKLTRSDQLSIDNAIELTRIQLLLDKKLFELSDGQLQMAMIARALAQETPILLLDEPTAHLDLNNRVEIMNLLRSLSRTLSKAILIATHELDLALQTADLIWLTDTNKKIRTGIPEDLVLNGSFDEIFRFKGFDLKTGKVFHEPFRNMAVSLVGEGYEYLWTKNALERCGYQVSDNSTISILISKYESGLTWTLKGQAYFSLNDLLSQLSA